MGECKELVSFMTFAASKSFAKKDEKMQLYGE
jgi:hypothetical protein